MGWLEGLQEAIVDLQGRWSLTLAPPFAGAATCSWVAPAVRADGTLAVLKLGMPHMDGRDELAGLQLWDGGPFVRLLEADPRYNAMLLERCEPGTPLSQLQETGQDVIIAGLLRRLWRPAPVQLRFRHLSVMLAHWAGETMAAASSWSDAGLVRAGLRLFETLAAPATTDVLLATDLHAGNVLRARREPWLIIDPKPFVGDRTYDATQHLFNCRARLAADRDGTIRRLADLLELDQDRLRLWLFARAAAEPRDRWDEQSMALARMLA